MNKAILMTIRPEHLVNVLNGEKTVDIRKTIPKNIELPCDVYLVCSKAEPYLYTYSRIKENSDWEWERMFFVSKEKNAVAEKLNGKVVCKFTPNKIDEKKYDKEQNCYWASEFLTESAITFLKKCCLTKKQFKAYGNGKTLYAYHIDNLVIFDTPKELNEFYKQNSPVNHIQFINWYKDNNQLENYYKFVFNKAPQSWQYVWVKE